jgi:hypothetical protein
MSELTAKQKSVALDSLALIACAERGDQQSFELLLGTFDPDEYQNLIAAVIGHSVSILRVAASEIGIPPEKLLGAVRTSLVFTD